MLRLYCLLEGGNVVFPVQVPRNSSVPVLCDHIRETNLGKLVDVALWKVNIDLEPYKEDVDSLRLIKVDEDRDTFLPPWKPLSKYWSDDNLPLDERLHVVAKVSPIDSDWEPLRKRQRTNGTEDFDLVGLWMSNRANQPIPAIHDLLGFIERPLSDDEKIPITQSEFDRLLSTPAPDICDASDLRSLFRIGEPLNHMRLDCITFAIRHTPFSISGSTTENSYIFGWDLNIRTIIDSLERSGHSDRNTSEHTVTRNLRPDFKKTLGDKCVLRGEENGPQSLEHPKEELGSKLEWMYDPAPYVFGYYCKGAKMTLCALIRPVSTSRRPFVHDLVTVDLQLTKDRISNVRHLINLASLLAPLAAMIPSSMPEFLSITREKCKIDLSGKHVVKRYTSQDGHARVKGLETHYHLLQAKRVPNVDQLLYAFDNTVVLTPRGIACEPKSETELRQCLSCILETLIMIHDIPFYHRDIRWNNVICRIDDPTKWFLIDWEDTASPPTTAQNDFRHSSHSPAIFQDRHGAEVDIWAVGHLITTCKARVSENLMLLGFKICREYTTLTARDVDDRLLAPDSTRQP